MNESAVEVGIAVEDDADVASDALELPVLLFESRTM